MSEEIIKVVGWRDEIILLQDLKTVMEHRLTGAEAQIQHAKHKQYLLGVITTCKDVLAFINEALEEK